MSKHRQEETGSQAETEGDDQRIGKCLNTDKNRQVVRSADKCLKTDEKTQVVRQRQMEMFRE